MSSPQQQWPPAPARNPPPRRRRSRWLTVGLPVGLVAVAALGVLGFVVAHAMLCRASAEEFTAQELATSFGGPPLTGSSIEGVDVLWSNGRTTGDATVVFESDGGVRERTVLPLVEEDGTWRPCP